MRGEYLLLLLGSLVAVLVLDRIGQLGVLRQPRRLVLALLPATIIVLAWDIVGIIRWGWSSDPRYILGVYAWGDHLPLEEIVFPLAIGICALVVWALVGRLRER